MEEAKRTIPQNESSIEGNELCIRGLELLHLKKKFIQEAFNL